jgi:hypothetical protein
MVKFALRACINRVYEKNDAVGYRQEQGARGELSHNKENKFPLYPTAEYAAVTDNAIFKFW